MSILFPNYVKYSGALHNPNKSDLCKVMRTRTDCRKIRLSCKNTARDVFNNAFSFLAVSLDNFSNTVKTAKQRR